jgi:F0F1-type ATP synthase membrane subunit b/b'
MIRRKHSGKTRKELAFDLKYIKRRIAENLEEAKRLHQYAQEIAEESRKRARESGS